MIRANMSDLGRTIYDKVVSPAVQNNITGAKGVVLGYDYIKKTADVVVRDPHTAMPLEYYDIPVEDHGRGVHFVSIKPGNEVWVSFVSPAYPVITTVFSEKKELENLKVHNGPQVPRSLGR